MYCSKCGTQNADGAAFCQKCGTQVNRPSPSAPLPPTPPPVQKVDSDKRRNNALPILLFIFMIPCFLFTTMAPWVGVILMGASLGIFVYFFTRGNRKALSIVGICFAGIFFIACLVGGLSQGLQQTIEQGRNEPKTSQGATLQTQSPTPTPMPTPTPEPVIEISAVDLLAAYDNNDVRANQDYKGKLLAVTGLVSSINSDSSRSATVRLQGESSWDWSEVACYFSGNDAVNKLVNISKGQEVTIFGRCSGESLFSYIVLDDCQLK